MDQMFALLFASYETPYNCPGANVSVTFCKLRNNFSHYNYGDEVSGGPSIGVANIDRKILTISYYILTKQYQMHYYINYVLHGPYVTYSHMISL